MLEPRAPGDRLSEERTVKKLLVAAAAAAGAVVWRKVQQDKAEQELWAEVTDPVTPPR